MVNVITSFSRITILIFVGIFTFLDLLWLFENKLNESLQSIIGIVQAAMALLFLFNATFVLYEATEETGVLLMMAAIIFVFIIFSVAIKYLNGSYEVNNRGLLNNVFFFTSLGMVYLERLKSSLAARQFISLLLALVVGFCVVLLFRNISNIERHLYVFLIVGIALLLVVRLFGGVENGAKLSMAIGSLRFQPSEFVKITFALFISGCIVKYKDYKGLAIATIGAAAHVLILVFSRDLGMALIFLLTYVFVVFIAYKNYIVLGLEIGCATIGGFLAYNLFPHIQTRFIAWSDPLSVVDDKGYQISQSLFAIGTGGWLGSGIFKGMPKKIPVVTMDFIFAAITEELGVLVAVCIIICFGCCGFLIFNSGYKCNNSFYMLTTCGIGVGFCVQTILNIGGVIKFIPSTGVTLPFVSYGSNSIFALIISMYLVCCSNSLYLQAHNRGRHHDK